MKYNDHPTIEDAWRDEIARFEWDPSDYEVAECADLADELAYCYVLADKDSSFAEKMDEWYGYIMDYQLWLALEQCCYQGVLLPMGQRELRVKTCPQDMLGHLSYFFSRCPPHVKHNHALTFWVMVRVDRARRTGNPDWRPETAPPRSPLHDTVFFRPPVLKFRNYAR